MIAASIQPHLFDDISSSLFGLRNYHMGTVPTWFVADGDLWDLCRQAMGANWCSQFSSSSECAAMILAMALLKQIKVD